MFFLGTVAGKVDNRPSHPECERCNDLPPDFYKRAFYRRQQARTALYVALTALLTTVAAQLPAILALLGRKAP